MFSLAGQVAVVTGGSRGIGRAIAEALAAQGAHVVVGFGAREDAAREVAHGIETSGGTATVVKLDLASMAAAEEAIAAVAAERGRLDILVANAGVAIDGLLLRLKEEDLDELLAINVKGAIACARGAIKAMMRRRRGRVLFVSSVVGEIGNAGQTGYAASKAALLGITRSLAREYASRGITVNALTPGFIETDMTARLDGAQREALLAGVPLGRIGTPRDVAAAAVFLASEEAGYVTGHTLRVNGGMLM